MLALTPLSHAGPHSLSHAGPHSPVIHAQVASESPTLGSPLELRMELSPAGGSVREVAAFPRRLPHAATAALLTWHPVCLALPLPRELQDSRAVTCTVFYICHSTWITFEVRLPSK